MFYYIFLMKLTEEDSPPFPSLRSLHCSISICHSYSYTVQIQYEQTQDNPTLAQPYTKICTVKENVSSISAQHFKVMWHSAKNEQREQDKQKHSTSNHRYKHHRVRAKGKARRERSEVCTLHSFYPFLFCSLFLTFFSSVVVFWEIGNFAVKANPHKQMIASVEQYNHTERNAAHTQMYIKKTMAESALECVQSAFSFKERSGGAGGDVLTPESRCPHHHGNVYNQHNNKIPIKICQFCNRCISISINCINLCSTSASGVKSDRPRAAFVRP